ncbi:MAG: isopenicillin N synthase family oxygenase [Gammaproteobacteria bacterium]|nr:isopenicillin N synthase family oxygenase [Gammaproteobacteria bacterium]
MSSSAWRPGTEEEPARIEQIPVIDVSRWLAGDEAALEAAAGALRDALERVGFYCLVGHDVPQSLIDEVFDACRRFHAQPLEDKLALKANHHNIGYMPVNGYVSRSSKVEKATRPNLVEAFFVKRDLAPDHPDVLADKRFRGLNQWPDEQRLPALHGFRHSVVRYCDAMEALCIRLLPMYARAFDLPASFFEQAFVEPQYTLRMSHYPPAETGSADQYGVAPHTDSSFLTMLAQSELPGLAIRLPDGRWLDAPVIDGAFVVNSGDMLRRWTNDRFLSTPHRVVNRTPGRDRYAIPFFFDANIDYPMACLPSCQSAEDPPRYEPMTFMQYMDWFTRQYDHIRDGKQTARTAD